MIEELRLQVGGLRFRALAAGPAGAQPALLLHGFPEGAESWLPQLAALGEAGLRAVAPDLRGYGGSDAPEGVDAYLLPELAADVVGLMDALGAERVHLAGHDWGAIVGWPVASRHQDRLLSWSALSVGHPRALAEVMGARDADQAARSAYIQVLMQPGTAEELLLENDAERLRAIYGGAFPRDVENGFVAGLQRPGRLTAGLSYYRANFTAERFASYDPCPLPIQVPTQLIWGTADPALGRLQAEKTGAHLRGPYEFAPLAGAGHWLQHERPAEVSELLVRHMKTGGPTAAGGGKITRQEKRDAR